MRQEKTFSTNALSLLVAGAGLAIGLSTGSAQAQTVPVTFTEGQAQTGQGVYRQSCESCHGDTLQGLLEAPALTGPRFQPWLALPVRDMYDFIVQFMPQDKPTSLSKKQYADVTAYILKFNGVPAGNAELPEDPPKTMVVPK